MFRKAVLIAVLLAASLATPLARPALADNPKIVLAPPGVPPIFISIIAFVAADQGFFKKYGVAVELRQFDNGTAAARAVVAGDIDASMSATALLISQIANAGVPLTGIYGFPKPDFELGTTNLQKATCEDVKGQQIGVDTPGGARSIALKAILGGGCHMSLDDVQQVALGSNTSSALLAGQISYGILHLDDVSEIENRGKKVAIIKTVRESNPASHNLIVVATKDDIAKKRDGFVRMMAGLIAAGALLPTRKTPTASRPLHPSPAATTPSRLPRSRTTSNTACGRSTMTAWTRNRSRISSPSRSRPATSWTARRRQPTPR